MADKTLASLVFPGLPDRYVVPDNSADIEQIKEDLSELRSDGAVLTARQLLSDKYAVDKTPYKFRASYSGDRMDDSIVGGSVVWNQLVQNGNFSNGTAGWSTTGGSITASNGTVTITKNSSTGNLAFYQSVTPKNEGHKVWVSLNAFASTPLTLSIYWGDRLGYVSLTTTPTTFGIIGTVTGGNTNFNLQGQNIPGSTSMSYSNIQLFDLTRMFGAEVADYIYGLEQANAGDGVAYVRKMFPEEYYVYSEPTLKHVEGLSAHVMRDADSNIIANYPLDSALTLRGIPKLGDNGLYFDGDHYKADGTVERNYGIRTYQSGDDSLTDAITDGTNTVYKLTTQTTETATPYTALQIVDASGTEEYVSTSIVPVGHYTKYYDDLRKKLDGLPWNFANLIAPTEVSYTATRNYTTGNLLIVDNTLYNVTANIANGGAITPNTNVTATTLAEVISVLQ